MSANKSEVTKNLELFIQWNQKFKDKQLLIDILEAKLVKKRSLINNLRADMAILAEDRDTLATKLSECIDAYYALEKIHNDYVEKSPKLLEIEKPRMLVHYNAIKNTNGHAEKSKKHVTFKMQQ